MATTEEQGDDDVATYDARPQQASNRPGDLEGRRVEVEPDPGARRTWLARGARPGAAAHDEAHEDVAAQVATVFGYAMVGAVLFHVGWWVFSGA